MKGTKTLKRRLAKAARSFKRASPTILAVIGSAGVVATTVMAIRATPKANQLIADKKSEKGEKLTVLETIQATGMTYASTAIVGIATIGCIFGSNALNKRSQASMASAYALLQQSYRQYRTSAEKVYGEEADSKIKSQMAKDTYISADGFSVLSEELDRNGDKMLFYDEYSGRYFTTTMAAVLNAEYHLNRNFQLRGSCTVNEFYEFLGLDTIDGGDYIGWFMNWVMDSGICWLDFDNHPMTMDDGMECCLICPLWDPETYEEI